MPIPVPGIKDAFYFFKEAYKALDKLKDQITREEDDKYVAELVKQIHHHYLSGKHVSSPEIQLILSYLSNLGVDIASLDVKSSIKIDLLKAASFSHVPILRSTDIGAALADKKKAVAKPVAKKVAPKPAAKKAAAKPAAKKAAAKPAAKPAVKKAVAKPATQKAAAKPAAKNAAIKAAAKPAIKKVAAKPATKKA